MTDLELPIKVEGIIFCNVDDRYQFLLLQRSPEDGGFWQPLTGGVSDGEKVIDCLKRELKEETGIEDIENITERIWSFAWENKKGEPIIDLVYGVELLGTDGVSINPAEHTDYKWCGFDEAIKLLGKDNNKKAFEKFKEKIINK